MDEGHDAQVAKLFHEYQRYRLKLRARGQDLLDYVEWLEHNVVRLADKLADAVDTIDELEEERDRYKHAATTNHELWLEMMSQRNKLYEMWQSLRHLALSGDAFEVMRLLLNFMCWN
jgi:predicted RNase H-like nuclease (RuvC/YqgF family)